MLKGARAALAGNLVDALLISGRDYLGAEPPATLWVEGAHPVPDERSLAAGRSLLAFIDRQPTDRHLLFLISGGASSMMEVPREGIDAGMLDRVNRWLLASGLAIGELNAVRKSLSRVKGGGLLGILGTRPATVLLISDVPGDDPGVIGSGLLVPDIRAASVAHGLELPDWLASMLPPPRGGVRYREVSHHLIATNRVARSAAADTAIALGYRASVHDALVTGDAATAGRRLAHELLDAPSGIHLWGGETTVRLPSAPGRGGRSQHLALAAARVLAGKSGVALLSAGTDGCDGPGADAGAIVDGGTLERGRDAGFDVEDALIRADSGGFLEAAGDLVHTGPTGTNVMDLIIGWKSP